MIDKIKEAIEKKRLDVHALFDNFEHLDYELEEIEYISCDLEHDEISFTFKVPDNLFDRNISIYKLIFSKELGFLEALVGDKSICDVCGEIQLTNDPPNEFICLKCGRCTVVKASWFIRQQLANMTLDEIVEYVGKL